MTSDAEKEGLVGEDDEPTCRADCCAASFCTQITWEGGLHMYITQTNHQQPLHLSYWIHVPRYILLSTCMKVYQTVAEGYFTTPTSCIPRNFSVACPACSFPYHSHSALSWNRADYDQASVSHPQLALRDEIQARLVERLPIQRLVLQNRTWW